MRIFASSLAFAAVRFLAGLVVCWLSGCQGSQVGPSDLFNTPHVAPPRALSAPAPHAPLQPAPSNVLQTSVHVPSGTIPRVLARVCRVIQTTREGLLCLQSATSRTVLWVEGLPCEMLEVTEDGRPVTVTNRYVQGGCQLNRPEPSQSPRFTLGLRSKDTGTQFWQLPVDRSKPWLTYWTDTMWNRATVDLDGVDAELRRQSVQQTEPAVALDMSFGRGVALFRLGYNDLAVSIFSQMAETAARLGYIGIAFDASHLQFIELVQSGDLDDADLVIQSSKTFVIPENGAALVSWNWDVGRLLYEAERLDEAELALRRSIFDAERLDLRNTRRLAMPILAVVLLEMERFDEAWSVQLDSEKLLNGADDCSKAALQSNLAENVLEFIQDDEKASSLPSCNLAHAREMFNKALATRRSCLMNIDVARLHIGLATISFLENQLKEAKAELELAKSVQGATHIDLMDTLNLEGQISLRENRPKEAQYFFENLSQLVKAHPNSRASHYGCKAATGLLESATMLGGANPTVTARVQDCLRAERLSPFRRKIIQKTVPSILQPAIK